MCLLYYGSVFPVKFPELCGAGGVKYYIRIWYTPRPWNVGRLGEMGGPEE
jgi:hypothetical protein